MSLKTGLGDKIILIWDYNKMYVDDTYVDDTIESLLDTKRSDYKAKSTQY